jgi:hypothetical protein
MPASTLGEALRRRDPHKALPRPDEALRRYTIATDMPKNLVDRIA